MFALLKLVHISSYLMLHPYSDSNRREGKPLKMAEKCRNHECADSPSLEYCPDLGKASDIYWTEETILLILDTWSS